MGCKLPFLICLLVLFTVLCLGCHHVRRMASLVNVEKQGNVAVLELSRKPVNSFSLEFLQEINENLDQMENDQDCRGIIITSVSNS